MKGQRQREWEGGFSEVGGVGADCAGQPCRMPTWLATSGRTECGTQEGGQTPYEGPTGQLRTKEEIERVVVAMVAQFPDFKLATEPDIDSDYESDYNSSDDENFDFGF